MAAAAAAGWQAPWRALGALGRELAAEWAAQDVRAVLCQLLLLWLGLSLLGVRLAWRAYGGWVPSPHAGVPCRGATPAPLTLPLSCREGLVAEPAKTHRE
uniref:T-cell leukemia translocation-altered gene protein homolog n=1 Tax=Aquila chrysaetos chrysaetos TaxID=223781 RepID=A0A663ESZ1_AQUCH